MTPTPRLARPLLSALAGALLLAVVGCEAGSGAAAPPVPGDEALRVLFVGNSHTAVHDVPGLVAALARADGRAIAAEAVVRGGVHLGDHLQDGEALRRLSSGRWDVVVLQQGPSALPESRVQLLEFARAFEPPIRAAGAVPALYSVWPTASRRGDFEASAESYRQAAEAVGGLLMPAGRAWLEAWAADPALALYGSDGQHASATGAYLAALVIYGRLFDADPIGLPARLDAGSEEVILSEATARTLQEAAARALGR